MADILQRLNAVFQDVFDDDTISVGPETTAKDIEDWDSMKHVSLIVAIERVFGIRFTSHEVAGMTNVADLLNLIQAKTANSG